MSAFRTAHPPERTRFGLHMPAGVLFWLTLMLTVAVGIMLRLDGIWSQSLSFDEGATYYFAHLPMADLWGAPAWLETNPPLYYTIEHGVVALFGNGAATLRLAGVAAGVLCVPIAALIAYRAGGPAAGLAAAALVATSASSIEASQSARTYSALTLAALVAIAAELSLLRTYRDPVTDRRRVPIGAWVSYVLAGIASLYLHNTAALMIVALNLVAALCWVTARDMQRRFAAHWIAANAVILAVYAAWLPVVAYQSVHTMASFWIPAPTLVGLRYAMMNTFAQPLLHILQPVPDLLFVVTGLGGIVLYRSNRGLLGLAVFVLLGVPVLTWVISQWRPLTNGKTLLWLVPVFLIFVALGCTWHRRLAVPLTAALVAVQLVACFSFFQTREDDAFFQMAAVLRTLAEDGDVIYLHAPADEILLNYYGWPRERLRVYAPGPVGWFRDFDGVTLSIAEFERIRHAGRVWIFTATNRAQHRSLVAQLSARMTETFARSSGGLELSLLAPQPEPAPHG